LPQTTFADISKVSILESLSEKQLRIVRLLREGHTQGTISKRMNISRASVSQTCKRLEENNLIKKLVGKNYNVLYEVSVDLQKRIGININ
jgi:DNA-binding MarR family transcriptional regulator